MVGVLRAGKGPLVSSFASGIVPVARLGFRVVLTLHRPQSTSLCCQKARTARRMLGKARTSKGEALLQPRAATPTDRRSLNPFLYVKF